MTRIRPILAVLPVLLAACAGMPPDDRGTVSSEDHARCEERGYAWPAPGYEECRYDLAEQRHQRDWQNLRLLEMPRINQGPERPQEPYRPLSRAAFQCFESSDTDGQRRVDCIPQR